MTTVKCEYCKCLIPSYLATETGELSEDVHREPLYSCYDCIKEEGDEE